MGRDVGDEYRTHCDGPCDGERYQKGQRVATSILYCVVAEEGGQTSFTRAGGLIIKPSAGDLLLFTYKHANNTMDNGLTEHSGCPLRRGRKWIATQWYREGVDYGQPFPIYENWD